MNIVNVSAFCDCTQQYSVPGPLRSMIHYMNITNPELGKNTSYLLFFIPTTFLQYETIIPGDYKVLVKF